MDLKRDLINVRVTYRKIPIHRLEEVTFTDLDGAYRKFLSSGIKGCVILQTCNRVEVYAVCEYGYDENRIASIWSEICNLKEKSYMEVSKGNDSLLHLFRLASGLDSVVIGEDQILSQVRQAFEYARENGYSDTYLNLIFDKAIRVGGRVRASTGINKGSLSYGSMAVKVAEDLAGGLNEKRILLIGSGEAASMVAKVLKKREINFVVTSRTIERARSFSMQVGGKPIPFEETLDKLANFDIIFVATTAPYFLITFERVSKAMKERDGKSMVIVDLSNPRTVEERVSEVGVKLINLDYIASVVEKNMKSRLEEVSEAEEIILEELSLLGNRMKRLEVEPIVDYLFKKADEIRTRELEKALQILGLSEEQKRVVERFSMALVEGILSDPMDNLRKASENGDIELLKAVTKLFRDEKL